MPKTGRRPYRRPLCQHCMVWTGSDFKMTMRCAHCHQAGVTVDLSATYTEEQFKAAITASRLQHKNLCHRPVRSS